MLAQLVGILLGIVGVVFALISWAWGGIEDWGHRAPTNGDVLVIVAITANWLYFFLKALIVRVGEGIAAKIDRLAP